MDRLDQATAVLRGPITCLNDLVGRCVTRVECTNDELILYLTDHQWVRFYHEQDCCESVYIEDICGDLEDLVDSPFVFAEESTNRGTGEYGDSATWTFYRFQTRKGSVDVRWCGESNGYYSESVDIHFENPCH